MVCARFVVCVVMLEFVFHIVGSFCVILGQVSLEFGPIMRATSSKSSNNATVDVVDKSGASTLNLA